jgi:hypothetical protein
MEAAVSNYAKDIMTAGVRVTELQDTIKLHGVDSPQFYAAAAELKVVQEFYQRRHGAAYLYCRAEQFQSRRRFLGSDWEIRRNRSQNLVGVNNKELTTTLA